MTEICPTCGLPKDICACGVISAGQQLVVLRLETRRWGKLTTLVEGLDPKAFNLRDVGSKLRSVCACGGTSKDGMILLQGDHRAKVKKFLVQTGIPEGSIEIH
jgi:translation initiation factor 1